MRAGCHGGDRAGRGRPRGPRAAHRGRAGARGRNRIQVNRQRLPRSRDLLGALRVSVFAPDDLGSGQGRPGRAAPLPRRPAGGRRPQARRGAHRGRPGAAPAQRAAAPGRRAARRRGGAHARRVGRQAGRRPARRWPPAGWRCWTSCGPTLAAGLRSAWPRREAEVDRHATASTWLGQGLAAALAAARSDDVRRGVTLVGPHRDDLELALGGLPARTHASQGEQRSLALALRLAAHRSSTEAAGSAAGAAARRRVLRARPGPQPPRCSASLGTGPDAAHHRRRPSARTRSPIGCCGSTDGRRCRAVPGSRSATIEAMPWQPLPSDP